MSEKEEQDLGFDFLEDELLPGLELNTEFEAEEIPEEEYEIPLLEEEEEEKEEKEEKKETETTTEVAEKVEVKKEETDDSEKTELSIKFSDFYNVLKENELIELEEGEEITEESLIYGLQKAVNNKAANQIYDLVTKTQGQVGWKLFEDVFIKGAGKEYLLANQEQLDLDNLDLDDEVVQEQLYRQYLSETSQMDPEGIDEQIEFLIDKDKLAARAHFARKELIKTRDSKKEAIATKAEAFTKQGRDNEQGYITALSTTLSEVAKTKEIDGVPLTADDSRVLVSYMTNKKIELTNGMKISEFERDMLELRKDPRTALKLAKLVKEKLNTTPIENNGISKKANFLFKEIESEIKKQPKKAQEEKDLQKLLKMLD